MYLCKDENANMQRHFFFDPFYHGNTSNFAVKFVFKVVQEKCFKHFPLAFFSVTKLTYSEPFPDMDAHTPTFLLIFFGVDFLVCFFGSKKHASTPGTMPGGRVNTK